MLLRISNQFSKELSSDSPLRILDLTALWRLTPLVSEVSLSFIVHSNFLTASAINTVLQCDNPATIPQIAPGPTSNLTIQVQSATNSACQPVVNLDGTVSCCCVSKRAIADALASHCRHLLSNMVCKQ
jgi:hypothetical protein